MFRESKEILKRLVEVSPKGLFEGELLKDIGYDEYKCKELLGNLVQLGWVEYNIDRDVVITERGIHMLAVMMT